MTTDGRQGKESQFSSVMWPLGGWPYLTEGPTPVDIQEALSGLSGFLKMYVELGGESIGTIGRNWRQVKRSCFD